MLDSLKNRLLIGITCLAWLILVSFFVVKEMGGTHMAAPSLNASASQGMRKGGTGLINDIFGDITLQGKTPMVNAGNPFYFPQIQPQVPPPPKTRKVNLVFRGFFTTTHGDKYAYVVVDEKLMVGPIGSKLVGNLSIADITAQGLAVKSDAPKETILPFNLPQTIEIPI
jgi:hypothetical protein